MKKILMPLFLMILLFQACREDEGAVTPANNYYETGSSNNFVVTPAEGDTWSTGSSYQIKWSAFQNKGKVDLILLKKQQYYLYVIASDIANTGSFSWQVPQGIIPSNHYQIKIIWKSDISRTVFSGVFKIM